jgi:hypothetical protein
MKKPSRNGPSKSTVNVCVDMTAWPFPRFLEVAPQLEKVLQVALASAPRGFI